MSFTGKDAEHRGIKPFRKLNPGMKYPETYLDSEGYPTEELLGWIKQYDVLKEGLEPLLEVIEESWWMPDWGIVRKRQYDGYFSYELHTGGWSGNEDIISALRTNMFFFIWWRKSYAGGHYYFKFPVKSFFNKTN